MMVTILRDAGLSALIESDAIERLAGGFQFTEGPLWQPDGSLLFQDIKAERTVSAGPGPFGAVAARADGGGQRPDVRSGRFRSSSANRTAAGSRAWRPTTAQVETIVETWSGARLNSPNDIVCRSDGLIYFTDPAYGVEPSRRALHFQGVFALDPVRTDPRALRLLADDFEKPNGLAFSPDEQTLYVCDTGRYHVRAFDVEADGTSARRLEPRLRAARPGSARRSRRDESRPGRPGLRRRRAGGLGVRARRPPAGNPLPAGPPVEPGLVRPRCARPGDHGRRRGVSRSTARRRASCRPFLPVPLISFVEHAVQFIRNRLFCSGFA